ncbi:gamma tubulin complex subunit Alp16 [Schizosaccharomyces japonicus yFS275]|uniref:Gamma tubulin complex subunit Alp16 n=1 Tax=Schizosaccharomyces japonicus (strain yFS275 / FY16936) TaxID=402676 RepID=B6JYT7_SCHJY|nr:gamma tubulin complex subunit Alp16 [Schizosaccharomyces japonicus yFS275]EEB06705.1 gamma tubulin complex subunit Alp16 [Schizosaccharomyces japonicus yFS275]
MKRKFEIRPCVPGTVLAEHLKTTIPKDLVTPLYKSFEITTHVSGTVIAVDSADSSYLKKDALAIGISRAKQQKGQHSKLIPVHLHETPCGPAGHFLRPEEDKFLHEEESFINTGDTVTSVPSSILFTSSSPEAELFDALAQKLYELQPGNKYIRLLLFFVKKALLLLIQGYESDFFRWDPNRESFYSHPFCTSGFTVSSFMGICHECIDCGSLVKKSQAALSTQRVQSSTIASAFQAFILEAIFQYKRDVLSLNLGADGEFYTLCLSIFLQQHKPFIQFLSYSLTADFSSSSTSFLEFVYDYASATENSDNYYVGLQCFQFCFQFFVKQVRRILHNEHDDEIDLPPFLKPYNETLRNVIQCVRFMKRISVQQDLPDFPKCQYPIFFDDLRQTGHNNSNENGTSTHPSTFTSSIPQISHHPTLNFDDLVHKIDSIHVQDRTTIGSCRVNLQYPSADLCPLSFCLLYGFALPLQQYSDTLSMVLLNTLDTQSSISNNILLFESIALFSDEVFYGDVCAVCRDTLLPHNVSSSDLQFQLAMSLQTAINNSIDRIMNENAAHKLVSLLITTTEENVIEDSPCSSIKLVVRVKSPISTLLSPKCIRLCEELFSTILILIFNDIRTSLQVQEKKQLLHAARCERMETVKSWMQLHECRIVKEQLLHSLIPEALARIHELLKGHIRQRRFDTLQLEKQTVLERISSGIQETISQLYNTAHNIR